MSDLSSAAKANLESARQSDGKFGTQPHANPGQLDLSTDDSYPEPTVYSLGARYVGEATFDDDTPGSVPHPKYVMSYANDIGATIELDYLGPVNTGEPDPDEVLALYCADYRDFVEDCGGDYQTYREDFGIDETYEDVDEANPDDQSKEWREWKDEYDKATTEVETLEIDGAEDAEIEAAQSAVDAVLDEEPERISKQEAKFNRSVEKLNEFKGFIGTDYDRYLDMHDNEM